MTNPHPQRPLQLIRSPRPEPANIDYFGGCPECWRNDGYLNIGREHWFVCSEHQVKWIAGENLFSTWRFESDLDWQRNATRIAHYRNVEPVHAHEVQRGL